AAKADWLLGLLRVRFFYPEPGTVTVKVLFFKIFDSGKAAEAVERQTDHSEPAESKKSKKAKSVDAKSSTVRTDEDKGIETQTRSASTETAEAKTTKTKTDKTSAAEAQTDEAKQVGDKATAAQTGKAKPAGNSTAKSITAEAQASKSETTDSANQESMGSEADARQANNDKRTPLEKIQYTFQKICDKIKERYGKIQEARNNVEHYRDILLREDAKGLLNHAFMRFGRILKSIRPRKLQADICFGTGAPDTTGYVFGIYGILCSYLGENVILTPDFERAVLTGELYAAGHITIFKLLWHFARIVLDKRLWKLYSKLKEE
ncbi:MAG: hypothetical protein NC092_08280, partial [Butyrivibrio sp.]|nr:hypothetical protein [Butyrivibrio sp.]